MFRMGAMGVDDAPLALIRWLLRRAVSAVVARPDLWGSASAAWFGELEPGMGIAFSDGRARSAFTIGTRGAPTAGGMDQVLARIRLNMITP